MLKRLELYVLSVLIELFDQVKKIREGLSWHFKRLVELMKQRREEANHGKRELQCEETLSGSHLGSLILRETWKSLEASDRSYLAFKRSF